MLSERYTEFQDSIEYIATLANKGPRVIKNSDDLDVCASIVTKARDLTNRVENARKGEKDVYLQAGREVDAYFAGLSDRLTRIKNAFESVATEYQRKTAAEARQAAEAEAAKARAEEAKRQRLAAKADEDNRLKHADAHQAKAEEAGQRAEEAEMTAKASAADLVRTRTSTGVLATAKTEWRAEIVDYELIPLNSLRAYIKRDAVEAALRMAVKMGMREMPGVKVFEEVTASFR